MATGACSATKAVRAIVLGAVASLVLAAMPVSAAEVRVPGDWPSLKEAIDHCVDGDVVIVADGVWDGSMNRNVNFGGLLITVRSENGPEGCIIDCQNAGRAFLFDSGETSDAVVQGFTIRDGRIVAGLGGAIACFGADPRIIDCIFESNEVTSGAAFTGGGGAVMLDHSEASIEACRFYNNRAVTGGHITGFAGALTITEYSNGTITDCIFDGNSVTNGTTWFHGFGGAIGVGRYSDGTFERCEVRNSYAYMTGGAMYVGSGSEAWLVDCLFEGNTCYGSGGGISVDGTAGGAWVHVVRGTFAGNEAQGLLGSQAGFGGGGIVNTQGDLYVTNSVFYENESNLGAGVGTSYSGETYMTNCLFHHNTAYDAGAINTNGFGDTWMYNCTVVHNTATNSVGGIGAYGTGSVFKAYNSIVWGNTAPSYQQVAALAGGAMLVYYSDIQGGWSGTSIIDADPLFVDPGTRDYRLLPGSPVIDAAKNSYVPADDYDLDVDGDVLEPTPFDLGGLDRFIDDPLTPDTGNGAPPLVDMGAFEFEPVPLPCSADTDGNEVVDVDDLVNVIIDWGTDGSDHNGDIDGSGVVDVDDLVEVVLAWGPCP